MYLSTKLFQKFVQFISNLVLIFHRRRIGSNVIYADCGGMKAVPRMKAANSFATYIDNIFHILNWM